MGNFDHTNTVRVPNHAKLRLPTLRALKALGGVARISTIEEKVIEIEQFSDAITTKLLKGGPQRLLYNRLSWARATLQSRGYIEKSSRGVWRLTPAGEAALTAGDAPAMVVPATAVADSDGVADADEVDVQDEKPTIEEQLLQALLDLTPAAFEKFCRALLLEAGFRNVEVTQQTHDGGIDGYGTAQINDLMSLRVVFECKRYRGSVGPDVVRRLRGSLDGRADRCILLTTGSFTPAAREEAQRAGAAPVELIDGVRLVEMIQQYELGVKTELVVQPDWFASL
ncbi:MAG: restriction endonuclease [Alphaproteobacteria bacterium]|nr:restriction endonuclease [Alphaproteobacteria bacterium]